MSLSSFPQGKWLPSLETYSPYTWRLRHVTATGFFLLKPFILVPLCSLSLQLCLQLNCSSQSPLQLFNIFFPFVVVVLRLRCTPESLWGLTKTQISSPHQSPQFLIPSNWDRAWEFVFLTKFPWDVDSAGPGSIPSALLVWATVLDRSHECKNSRQEKELTSEQYLRTLPLAYLKISGFLVFHFVSMCL